MIHINTVRATTTGSVVFQTEVGNTLVQHSMLPDDADRLADELRARAKDARLIDTAIKEAQLILRLPVLGIMREEFAMKAEPETPVEKEVEKPKPARKPRQAKAAPAKTVRVPAPRRLTRSTLPPAPRGSLNRSTLTPPTRTRQPRKPSATVAPPVRTDDAISVPSITE